MVVRSRLRRASRLGGVKAKGVKSYNILEDFGKTWKSLTKSKKGVIRCL